MTRAYPGFLRAGAGEYLSMSLHDLPGQPGSVAPAPVEPTEVPLTRWQKFRMVVKVVELRLRFIALMAATGLIFAYWDTLWNHYEKYTRPPGLAHAAASDTEFYCPMHPTVVQDSPSTCPICGMPLSKRKKGEKQVLPPGVRSRVTLTSSRVEQAGVRTEDVAYMPLAETFTTVGYVESDERRHAHITSWAKGKARVEKLYVNFVGQEVKAGEPLAELYSPELYSAAQELLTARRFAQRAARPTTAAGRAAMEDPDRLVRLTIDKLKNWGVTQAQVDKILREGKADFRTLITAPVGGFVFEQFVVKGRYVEEGGDLFDVVDLSVVWVKAQVYEDQLARVRVGQDVEASVAGFPGEVFRGKVAFIDPRLDPTTRTTNVRYDLDNAGLKLKPGMFATVTLRTPVAQTPAYLARHPGASSRSLARLASLTKEEQKVCLVTNAKLGSMGEPVPIEVEGRKLWMCCEGCEPKLKGDSKRYLARLAAPPRDAVLTVPESAVIDTGARKVVYVEAEPGVFEGREVVLGPRSGDRYPVLEGLAPGEKVAAAGSFLIDAETRLNPGAAGAGPADTPAPAPSRPTPRTAAPSVPAHRH